MDASINIPKIFISYSWNPITNKEKVHRLAERLFNDGIHVILDEWDLNAGQDKNTFMEQMVNNEEISKVLLICNKDYAEKANAKKGGVGTETLIVSNEVYSSVDQTKFIPIVFEYENGKACVPTFVNSRIYIDLSNEEIFEENYELLLRDLFDRPKSKRPPLGSPPAYITEKEPIFLATAHKVATIKNALLNEKKNAILFVQDYLDSFVKAIDTFSIDESELTLENCDEVVLKKIEDLKVLRDDFISFINTYLTYSIDIDEEKLHGFFEKLMNYLYNQTNTRSSYVSIGEAKVDHLRFFLYELTLTFTAIMLEKEKFKELGYLFHNSYIVRSCLKFI
jgi:hypothetical protein